MKVLFVLAHVGFLRNFEHAIRHLLEQGSQVDLVLGKQHHLISPEQFDLIQSGAEGFRVLETCPKSGSDSRLKYKARFLRDVLHYLQPGFIDNELYWERLQKSTKYLFEPSTLLRVRRQRLLRSGLVRRVGDAVLSAAECFFPVDDQVEAQFDRSRPDVIVVSPLVGFHSRETDFVKFAHRRKIPSFLAVASWDNLVNKGVMKIRPDAVAVWNKAMAEEAVRYHRVPRERIFLTGSPIFDIWFGRKPREDRTAFLGKLGLDPAKKTILYLGSSLSIVGKNEHRLVAAWLAKIRSDPTHPAREANILIRPHPLNLRRWAQAQLKDSSAVVWPKTPLHPTDEATRSDFFDSLYHATTVVGINTSGMIEAAIVGRPVLCFSLGSEYGGKKFDKRWQFRSQRENLHFQHLLDSGFVKYAYSLDEHLDQLRTALTTNTATEAAQRFVGEFVRPLGPDVNASHCLSKRIQDLAVGGWKQCR